MGWMDRRRARRQYREGAITLNQMLERLGLPTVTASDLPTPKSMFYAGRAKPLGNAGDVWHDTSDPDNPVMWTHSGVEWVKRLPILTSPRPGSSGSIRIDGDGVRVTAPSNNIDPAIAGASVTSATIGDPPKPRADWRNEPGPRDDDADNGLTLLLWGHNCTTFSAARRTARSVEAAGWMHDAHGEAILTGILRGLDLRDYWMADNAATLISRIGWRRRVPDLNGWQGVGSHPLTDDEWAYIEWHDSRGKSLRELVNDVLAARPSDVEPEDVDARTSDGAADYGWMPALPESFVEEKGDPRQPWAIVADLHEAVEGLILDVPVEGVNKHCIEEYNAGLRNALNVLRERCEALGGHIDRPEPGEEPEPEPSAPDVEALREEVSRIGQQMMDRLHPLVNTAQTLGLINAPKMPRAPEVPTLTPEQVQAISDKVAAGVAPLLAAMRSAKPFDGPVNGPKGGSESQ